METVTIVVVTVVVVMVVKGEVVNDRTNRNENRCTSDDCDSRDGGKVHWQVIYNSTAVVVLLTASLPRRLVLGAGDGDDDDDDDDWDEHELDRGPPSFCESPCLSRILGPGKPVVVGVVAISGRKVLCMNM